MNVETPEDDLKAAAESVLGARIHVAGRLDFGNVNSVYRIEAGGHPYALKVFSNEGWPEPGKLPWVESSLARRGVPRATRPLHARIRPLPARLLSERVRRGRELQGRRPAREPFARGLLRAGRRLT